jgi:hypothetical protein
MRTATRSLIASLVILAELALLLAVRFVAPGGACCCVPFQELPFWCRREYWYMVLVVFCLSPVAARSVAGRLRADALGSSRLLVVLGTLLGAVAAHFALRATGYEGDVCGELPCSLPYELAGPAVLAFGAGAGAFAGTFLGRGARSVLQPMKSLLGRLGLAKPTSVER